ncbi:hypothetical protein V8Z74_15760 [Comamonas sp. w2-DMI]|uniref:hypothetical protein n=1 Tax=Comamonas sp. w2-DMI TaxID=3126391 RepID=UPI0032E4CAC8
MRFAQLLHCLPLIAASLPLPAAAEPPSSPSAPPSLLDPAAPTRPLDASPMAAGRKVLNADADWKAANAAVARFARGHADIVRWEKSQAGRPQPTPSREHSMHRKEQP